MWRDIGATYEILVAESIFERSGSIEHGPGSVKIVRRVQVASEERPNEAL
jgi:hypothetical protein